MILENYLVAVVPTGLYALLVRWRHRFAAREIFSRLGLRLGSSAWYLAALAASVPFLGMGVVFSRWTRGFHGSMTAPFSAQTPSFSVFGAIVSYALIATAIPEEILFRGLIAGALFRRFPFWRANLIQGAIFLTPHLLILFFAPTLWFLMPGVFALALVLGWLRKESGSVGPSIIVHAASNLGGALAVLSWTGR